ncbi:MAG: Ig-like domain-containing protein [Verrucomicrobiota bacterium]
MKKTTALLGLFATLSLAQAQNTTNLFPNGTFSTSSTVTNPSPEWLEVNGGGGNFFYSYPTTGGNPGDYGIIDNSPGNSWGIWVGGATTAVPLTSLGLTAGLPAIFLQDMIVLNGTNSAGTNLGGVKIEFWNAGVMMSTPGDTYPTAADKVGKNPSAWNTYAFAFNVPTDCDSIKIVPLWGPKSKVGYDNFRAVFSPVAPLTTAIVNPATGALRPPDFNITANASVSPGTVTNVAFFDGNTHLGDLTASPYVWSVTGASLGAHALKVVAKSSTGQSVTSAVVNITVSTEVNVTVDPNKAWNGYINVFETPANGGAYLWGSGWGTPDLRASFCGSKLTLSPNTIGDPAPYWYVTTNSPSVGNKTMSASFFVEPAGSLPGQLVTFSGTVLADSLLSAVNAAGDGWTVVAFIKDFTPNYSGFIEATAPMVNGAFNIQLQTSYDPANHVQYGFTVTGPCVWATDPALAGYGNVQIASASPIAPVAPAITSSLSGGSLKLSFPTEACYAYTVLSKANLTDSWSTLTVTNGTWRHGDHQHTGHGQ